MAEDSTDDEGVVAGDTNGYRGDTDPDTDDYLSEKLGPLAETWKGMRKGWWNEAGYETFLDYFLAEEKSRARMGFRSIYSKRKKRPRSQALADVAPPDVDLEAVESDATLPRGSRNRQVNVKLTELGYEALSEAARTYGLQPTTLARLLIHRGALAVLEAQKADQAEAA
jgi:hypothetical protein